jgi:subtilisin family serine protease
MATVTASLTTFLLACSMQSGSIDEPADDLSDLEARASGQYIVTLHSDGENADKTGSAWVAARGLVAEHVFDHSVRGCVLRGSPGMADELRKDPTVASVEQDMVVSLGDEPVDEVAAGADEVAIDAVGQVVPPGITRVGGSTFTDGHFAWVVDTGIDFEHDDLFVVEALSRNFVRAEPNDGEDLNGHGTHVAGTIGARDNRIDVVGVIPGAPLVAVRVLGSNGSGLISDIIAGVDYVASIARAGDVVNMSLSAPVRVAALDQAVVRAASKGIFFALSAGNDRVDAATASPAGVNSRNVFTVSAVGSDGCVANFSNFGLGVDFGAPGVGVQSTRLGGGTTSFNGTSQAAPHVAGVLLATRGNIRSDGVACRDPDGRPDPIAHR